VLCTVINAESVCVCVWVDDGWDANSTVTVHHTLMIREQCNI